MPQYDLCVACSECGNFHDVFLQVSLARRGSLYLVRDIYSEEFPPEFYEVLLNIECPITGTEMQQHDSGEMLLVAVEERSSGRR
jgi:hypothetical protein